MPDEKPDGIRRSDAVKMPEEPERTFATRRETPAAPGAGSAAAGFPTRREVPGGGRSGALPTRRELRGRGEGTPHDSGQVTSPDDVEVIVGLPAVLRERYAVIRELPAPGAEADVLLVRDRAAGGGPQDDRRVVKIYRPGVHAEQEVWAAVRTLRSEHVVRILDAGTAAGRDYEVMEFLPAGDLTGLRPSRGVGLPPETVELVVRQVAEALVALHERRVVHRDLKPENILLRRREPLELVVTDFGLSRLHEKESIVAASRSGTMAYLAPEVLLATGAQSSSARDWWALGIIVRELLTGIRPFEEMSASGIERAVLLRGVDLGNVEDPRMHLLCRGLLVKEPDDRWGARQVGEWLEGGSPAVVTEASAAGVRPLVFAGEKYRGRKRLARAVARNWAHAARTYFLAMGTPTLPSASWTDLRGWLAQFDDPDVDDVERLNDLIDRQLQPVDIPADLKVLSLVRWLDADLPAVYLGLSVSRADLPAVAALAATAGQPRADGEGEEPADVATAARLVEDLRLHDVLPRLARMHGGEGLDAVDRAWRELLRRYESRLTELMPAWPAEARAAVRSAGPRPYAVLLEQALDPTGHGRRLREQVRADLRLLPARVPWLVALDGDDPVTDALRLAVYPAAAHEAERLAQEERELRAAAEGRRLAWEEAERRRVAGTAEAANRARLYAGVVVAAMALVMILGVRGRSDLHNVLGLGAGVPVAVLLLLQEIGLAERLGGDYLHHRPMSGLGSRLSGAGVAIREGGDERWVVGTFVLLGVLIAVVVSLRYPVVPFVALGGGHLWLVERRRRTWERQHELAERNALEAP